MEDVRGGSDRVAWVSGLEPAIVWREFAGLAALPRRSKEEGLVRAHVLDRLGELGLVARTDRAGNVVADVPASSQAETVVLQAHLDMVCEADAGAGTDPAVDGVFPVAADGWVQAPGTTLGADDGIGVAVALAIAAEAASDPAGMERSPLPPVAAPLHRRRGGGLRWGRRGGSAAGDRPHPDSTSIRNRSTR